MSEREYVWVSPGEFELRVAAMGADQLQREVNELHIATIDLRTENAALKEQVADLKQHYEKGLDALRDLTEASDSFHATFDDMQKERDKAQAEAGRLEGANDG